MVAAFTLAWWMKADVAYFFSPQAPIELGAEGSYHFDQAVSNRYAQVHGVPTVRGWYVEEKDGSFVIVGLTDTALLVKRSTFEEENRRLADGKRIQPRQNPFFARGRLMARADAERYADVFREHEAWGGASASWLLLAEEPPGKNFATVSMFGFLLLFGALNGWLFIRGIQFAKR